MTTLKTFKAFNKDWTCRGFQYKVGETYTHKGVVKACESGFHSCQYPLDIFNYYNPCSSVFAEVESSGVISKEDSDSKVASETILINKELDIPSLIQEAIKYTTANCVEAGSQHATGDRAASSATGYQAASSATGDRAASLTTGNYSSSEITNTADEPIYACAIATGYQGKVKGTLGDALFLTERSDEGVILNVWSGIVGKKKIKDNTWYTLKDGKPAIVESNDE